MTTLPRLFLRTAAGIALAFCTLALGCASAQPTATAPAAEAASTYTLNVALYPYVPRLQQFQDAVSAQWQALGTGWSLNFVSWDCYSTDPPPDLDVYVFDAIFLSYFAAQGYLAPLQPGQIANLDDILPYARTGSQVGGTFFGIPQLGCANLLFYRQGDTALAQATTLSEVNSTLGECTYSGTTPPPLVGLMIDFSGGTTDASYYLDIGEDFSGTYTPDPPLPPADNLNGAILANLQELLANSSLANAAYESDDNPYQRSTWFGEGLGRATVGFSESMSAMGEAGRATVAFKLLPLADGTNISLYYADLVGVNANTARDPQRWPVALKLANLLASTELLVAAMGPTPEAPYPQYLMPVRTSVFQAFEGAYPLYGEMYALVTTSNPYLFRIGSDSRSWLNSTKGAIRQAIFANPTCPVPSGGEASGGTGASAGSD